MRKCKILLIALLAIGLMGCATSWQNKATVTYNAGSPLLKAVDSSFEPPCVAATLPRDKCLQLNKIGMDTVRSYIFAGNTLVMALNATDAIEQDNLMEQWPILWADFGRLTSEIIALVQQMQADATKTAMPARKTAIAITPGTIAWILAGLQALIQIIPDIVAAIQSGQVDQADIAVLVAKIQASQDEVKDLFNWKM